MKRVVIALLCVLFIVPYLLAWVDVPDSTWYSKAANWCEQEGLMGANNRDAFCANEIVMKGDLLNQLARILNYILEGSADILPAPDNWGMAQITTDVDGESITFLAWDKTSWKYWNGPMGKEPIHYTIQASDESIFGLFPEFLDEERAVRDAHLDFGDKTVAGRLYGTKNSDMESGGAAFLFYPNDHSEYQNAGIFDASAPSSLFSAAIPVDSAYRDGIYYLAKIGISYESVLETPAPRWYLAELLYNVANNDNIPAELFAACCDNTPPVDSGYETWLTPLYRAGIINGIDETGNFAPEEIVSRAQLATVLLRIANPNCRCD